MCVCILFCLSVRCSSQIPTKRRAYENFLVPVHFASPISEGNRMNYTNSRSYAMLDTNFVCAVSPRLPLQASINTHADTIRKIWAEPAYLPKHVRLPPRDVELHVERLVYSSGRGVFHARQFASHRNNNHIGKRKEAARTNIHDFQPSKQTGVPCLAEAWFHGFRQRT